MKRRDRPGSEGRPTRPRDPGGEEPGVQALQRVIRETVDPRELTAKLKEIALGADAEGNPLVVPVRERRAAIISLLDRGWGKPVTAVELSGADGEPIEVANATRGLGFTKDQLLRLLSDPRLLPPAPQLPEDNPQSGIELPEGG